jgi:hypothetical protein
MIFYLILLHAKKNHKNCSPCRMNFIRDEIVDKLMKQLKIFDIKYYLFNDVIVVVKSTIFKLKTINIYIYIYILVILYPQFEKHV